MISLRPMRESEYSAYLAYFIPEYAAEISSNYGLSDLHSLAQAKREIAADLPEGVNTNRQVLLCLIDQSERPEMLIGYLWYKPDPAMRSAFISDFHILAAHQGKGLGKQALEAFESHLKGKGFEQIKLRVAADNARARHVYEVTGFRVTGVNMSKAIASTELDTRPV
ncbi:GNAT family N-acetyltransferase [Rhizobium leguminosarum]|uniref:GNAT family N-acetyltransferase n=1 Tax=Rhizobium leguminosarum TaxID=384 RepID=A0A6P0B7T1_RHILE|nr:GNAT family N-acetyltransferase [Rhizobium leguminosarum]MBY5436143.1 N-acetyltransferase [Rhizobium leguminosarum]NEI35909.1 GNAT family N-acetyltransferase [Rhizobium leguminosarum]NEI42292.1 GNAT family N-acetyltransferase [Rhizobium leguminosarum]